MYKYYIIFFFVSSCFTNEKHEETVYYPNGKVKKVISFIEENKIILLYDSLGRKQSKKILEEDTLFGKCIDYYYSEKYNMEEHGELIDGEKVQKLYKYFSKNSGVLHKEIKFIPIINNEKCSSTNQDDSCYVYYYDNQTFRYSDSLTIIDDESCYFLIKPENEELIVNNDYEFIIETKCFKFNNMVAILGDYDENFRILGTNFDTLRSESNIIRLKFKPEKPGKIAFLGKLIVYNEVIIDGEEFWNGKNMYFRKVFNVKPR